jgi:hypothetical protein
MVQIKIQFLARKRILKPSDAVVKMHDLPSFHRQLDSMYKRYWSEGKKEE